MNKAYKYRIYPNAAQRELFSKTFGCVRFIYNRMLEDKIVHYQKTGKILKLTPAMYKAEFPWLAEVDSMALCNAQMQLQAAYRKFFQEKVIGFPKFRSKKSQCNSYTTNCINGNVAIVGDKLKLPKTGMVKIKLHRQVPESHKIKSVTISMTPDGKYYASILTEYDLDVPALDINNSSALGLDYSSQFFYAKATNDNGFGQFRTLLAYKLAEQGKMLITIDKWYPSSKLCRHCGVVNTELNLFERFWICPSCRTQINRDHNAAINIREAGLVMIA